MQNMFMNHTLVPTDREWAHFNWTITCRMA